MGDGRNEMRWNSCCLARIVALRVVFMLAVLIPGLGQAQAAPFQKSEHGIIVTVGDAQIELAVATPTAFRLSVSYDGRPQAIPSIFLAPANNRTPILIHVVQKDGQVGIASAAGQLLI